MKLNIADILYEISEDKRVYDKNIDLVDSGILDSFAVIELISRLEDEGIIIQLTRIDRNKLRTIKGIEELIIETLKNKDQNK